MGCGSSAASAPKEPVKIDMKGLKILKITTLICDEQNDYVGKDEVQITVSSDVDDVIKQVVRIERGQRMKVDIQVRFKNYVDVDLWELDTLSRDDNLGSQHVVPTSPASEPLKFKGGGADYKLVWSMHDA